MCTVRYETQLQQTHQEEQELKEGAEDESGSCEQVEHIQRQQQAAMYMFSMFISKTRSPVHRVLNALLFRQAAPTLQNHKKYALLHR